MNTTEAEQIMKRCQVGTRNYNEANNLHAECYRVIGKLLKTIEEMESKEPVAKPTEDMVLALRGNSGLCNEDAYDALVDVLAVIPLYTHPPQRTWVGLTDDEIEAIGDKVANTPLFGLVSTFRVRFARAIEAAHGIKE